MYSSFTEGTVENNILGAETRSISNDNDLLLIKNPSGEYTITIENVGDEEYYSLQTALLPDLGLFPMLM